MPNMIGSAPNCRPECTVSTDCPSSDTCINQRCVDPCPGSCASNTNCRVVNHSPVCGCIEGFTGNAFTNCLPITVFGKSNLKFPTIQLETIMMQLFRFLLVSFSGLKCRLSGNYGFCIQPNLLDIIFSYEMAHGFLFYIKNVGTRLKVTIRNPLLSFWFLLLRVVKEMGR